MAPLFGGTLAALVYEFFFAVNATPDKVASFLLPGYDPEEFDQHGMKRGVSGGAARYRGQRQESRAERLEAARSVQQDGTRF